MDVSVEIAQAREYNRLLAEYSQQLTDSKGDLDTNLGKITSNWESNGQDKTDYVKELEQQATNVEIIANSLRSLNASITAHLDELERTAARTVN